MSKKTTSSASKLEKLKKFSLQVKAKFKTTHKKTSNWLDEKAVDVNHFRHRSKDVLTAASMAGSMVMQGSINAQAAQQLVDQTDEKNREVLSHVTQDEYTSLIDKLKSVVTLPVGHMDKEQEMYVEQQLTDLLGFEVTAELEGHRLNHTIGIMGGEQHLKRYPGDSLSEHDAYLEAGMAPNRGAFGWFTKNGQLTEQAIQNEKYYFAVQTLYLPDWNSNHKELKPWYKFRKMIAINPGEEIAVVAVVGDAGPAKWVKKQSGGSPEVIREGKIWSKNSRGRVILLFVDDPENKIPLGPIKLSELVPETTKQ